MAMMSVSSQQTLLDSQLKTLTTLKQERQEEWSALMQRVQVVEKSPSETGQTIDTEKWKDLLAYTCHIEAKIKASAIIAFSWIQQWNENHSGTNPLNAGSVTFLPPSSDVDLISALFRIRLEAAGIGRPDIQHRFPKGQEIARHPFDWRLMNPKTVEALTLLYRAQLTSSGDVAQYLFNGISDDDLTSLKQTLEYQGKLSATTLLELSKRPQGQQELIHSFEALVQEALTYMDAVGPDGMIIRERVVEDFAAQKEDPAEYQRQMVPLLSFLEQCNELEDTVGAIDTALQKSHKALDGWKAACTSLKAAEETLKAEEEKLEAEKTECQQWIREIATNLEGAVQKCMRTHHAAGREPVTSQEMWRALLRNFEAPRLGRVFDKYCLCTAEEATQELQILKRCWGQRSSRQSENLPISSFSPKDMYPVINEYRDHHPWFCNYLEDVEKQTRMTEDALRLPWCVVLVFTLYMTQFLREDDPMRVTLCPKDPAKEDWRPALIKMGGREMNG